MGEGDVYGFLPRREARRGHAQLRGCVFRVIAVQWRLVVPSSVDSVVRVATEHCQSAYQKEKEDSLDGIVCCTHTEGSTEDVLHNRDKILRTLAGFLVHPNVGAAVVVTNDRWIPSLSLP